MKPNLHLIFNEVAQSLLRKNAYGIFDIYMIFFIYMLFLRIN